MRPGLVCRVLAQDHTLSQYAEFGLVFKFNLAVVFPSKN